MAWGGLAALFAGRNAHQGIGQNIPLSVTDKEDITNQVMLMINFVLYAKRNELNIYAKTYLLIDFTT